MKSLESMGAARLKAVVMNEPIPAGKLYHNAYGTHYFTGGRAVVVQP